MKMLAAIALVAFIGPGNIRAQNSAKKFGDTVTYYLDSGKLPETHSFFPIPLGAGFEFVLTKKSGDQRCKEPIPESDMQGSVLNVTIKRGCGTWDLELYVTDNKKE